MNSRKYFSFNSLCTISSAAIVLSALAVLMAGCKPKSYMNDLPDLVPNTDASVVQALNPRALVDSEDPNMVHLIMDEVDGWVGMWQVGNKRYTKACVDHRFEFAGDYTVQASAYNKNGVTPSVEVHFTVEQTDEAVCVNANYNALTGGCDALDGKTWILSDQTGYYGLIDINTWLIEYNSDYWWAAERGSHQGVYDDELTFVLDADMTYRHITNGQSGIDSNPFDCADYTAAWELVPENESRDGRLHLVLSGDGFLPPIPSECQGQHDYTVLVLNDTVLMTKIYKSGSNQAWVHKFVPKQ